MTNLVESQKVWERYGILMNTSQPPTKKIHIGWSVAKGEGSNLTLQEILEVWYPHPQAPENAIVPQIQLEGVLSCGESSPLYHALLLFYHTDNNLTNAIRNR